MKRIKRLWALAPAVATAFVLMAFNGDDPDVDTYDDFKLSSITANMGDDGTAWVLELAQK